MGTPVEGFLKRFTKFNENHDELGRFAETDGSGGGRATDSPKFKTWFGNSKIVDAGGKPLVMYHGTEKAFKEFATGMIGSAHPAYSIGFHFTNRPSEAGVYADDLDNAAVNFDPKSPNSKDVIEGANIMPVYLRAENPLEITTDKMSASMEVDLNRAEIVSQILASRKTKNPYDSVIIRSNSKDNAFGGNINVVVFGAGQIKSATGNSGEFDRTNPRMDKYNENHDEAGRFSSGGDALAEETGGEAQLGKEFMALRLGSPTGNLENRNAGNAAAVADHLVRLADPEAPDFAGGSGNTITVYGVTFSRMPGEYKSSVGGKSAVALGRNLKGSAVGYSFPKEGDGYSSRVIGRVSLADLNAKLKSMGYSNADDAGGNKTAQALRDLVGSMKKFNPYHDDIGRFAESDGAGSAHPGKGYSKDAYVRDGKIYTKNVKDAVRALYEDRKVVLFQARQVSTLIDRLRTITKRMESMGVVAPKFNLCNVSVPGTNLFCEDHKGLTRIQMPQKMDRAKFVAHLTSMGVKVEDVREKASYLRASQNQLDGSKVAGIAGRLRAGEFGEETPIFVSKDNYIVDGHHRWAAKIAIDAGDGRFGDVSMQVSRVDMGILDLLAEAHKFSGEHRSFKRADAERLIAIVKQYRGLFKKLAKYNENHDEMGRFASGESQGGGFGITSPEAFVAARDRSNRSGFLSNSTPDQDVTLLMNGQGTVGVAIDKHGDMQNLFNNGGARGAAAHAVVHAIESGARTLDCYDGYLNQLYRQFGFVETGRMRFNPAFAHGWDTHKYGTPDVVFMAWKGYPKGGGSAAITRAANRSSWLANEESKRYERDWDEAKEYSRGQAQPRGAGVAKSFGPGQGPGADGAGSESGAGSGTPSRGFVKYNENHDEAGRFTFSDGGTAGGGGKADGDRGQTGSRSDGTFNISPQDRSSIKELVDRKASIEEINAHPALTLARETAEGLPQTKDLPGYGTAEFRANREFEGGVKGYDAAVDRLISKAEAYAGGAVARDREAVIFLGPPASGKSYFAERLAREFHAAIPDADEAKMLLKEYRGGIGGNAVHEESSDIARMVLRDLYSQGTNMIIPKVGHSAESIMGLTSTLRNAGYTVHLVNMEVAEDTAFRRGINRFLSTGRLMSMEYTKAVDGGPTKTYMSIKNNGAYSSAVNIDNNPPPGGHVIKEGSETRIGKALAGA